MSAAMDVHVESQGRSGPPRGQITLDSVLAAAWRSRWLMIACVAVCTALAATAAFVMKPKYRAEVVIIPVKADDARAALSGMVGQLGGLASLAGLALPSGGNKDEYLQYLSSNNFTGRFIEDEMLLPVLFEDQWDASKNRWTVEAPEDVPTIADGVRMFDRSIRSVQEDRRTGIVKLTVVWTDRDLAARWANLMVERVNRDLRQRAIDEARASIKYLNEELAKTNVVELRAAIYRLLENQIKSVMLASVREQYAFKVIDQAIVPDADDFVRPKRFVMVLLGAAFGGMFGLMIVLWRLRRAPQ
jgi:uncharacterized protein involved in exopolysaccharide biosynthesis